MGVYLNGKGPGRHLASRVSLSMAAVILFCKELKVPRKTEGKRGSTYKMYAHKPARSNFFSLHWRDPMTTPMHENPPLHTRAMFGGLTQNNITLEMKVDTSTWGLRMKGAHHDKIQLMVPRSRNSQAPGQAGGPSVPAPAPGAASPAGARPSGAGAGLPDRPDRSQPDGSEPGAGGGTAPQTHKRPRTDGDGPGGKQALQALLQLDSNDMRAMDSAGGASSAGRSLDDLLASQSWDSGWSQEDPRPLARQGGAAPGTIPQRAQFSSPSGSWSPAEGSANQSVPGDASTLRVSIEHDSQAQAPGPARGASVDSSPRRSQSVSAMDQFNRRWEEQSRVLRGSSGSRADSGHELGADSPMADGVFKTPAAPAPKSNPGPAGGSALLAGNLGPMSSNDGDEETTDDEGGERAQSPVFAAAAGAGDGQEDEPEDESNDEGEGAPAGDDANIGGAGGASDLDPARVVMDTYDAVRYEVAGDYDQKIVDAQPGLPMKLGELAVLLNDEMSQGFISVPDCLTLTVPMELESDGAIRYEGEVLARLHGGSGLSGRVYACPTSGRLFHANDKRAIAMLPESTCQQLMVGIMQSSITSIAQTVQAECFSSFSRNKLVVREMVPVRADDRTLHLSRCTPENGFTPVRPELRAKWDEFVATHFTFAQGRPATQGPGEASPSGAPSDLFRRLAGQLVEAGIDPRCQAGQVETGYRSMLMREAEQEFHSMLQRLLVKFDRVNERVFGRAASGGQ